MCVYTHFTNMLTPVGSIARLMAFHEATIVHFCRAVSGRRSSVAAGAGGSLRLLSTLFLLPLLASLPSSHPMMAVFCRPKSSYRYCTRAKVKVFLFSVSLDREKFYFHTRLTSFSHSVALLFFLFSLFFSRLLHSWKINQRVTFPGRKIALSHSSRFSISYSSPLFSLLFFRT